MKALFAHDHIFRKYNNKYYSTGGLSSKALGRYTKVFDKLSVVSRQIEINNFTDNLTPANTKNVNFVKVPDFKGIKTYILKSHAKKIIRRQVKESDVIIARLPSSIGSLAVSEAKRAQKPYMIEVVACPWDSYWNHSIIGKLIAPLEYVEMRKLVKEASHVIYVTNEFLQKRYPTLGKYTNCSNVELTDFNNEILEKRLNKIKKSHSKIIIGTTAAVNVRYKGQQYIIQALGKLKKEGLTNFEYQLVGNGDTTYLKSVAKKYNVSEQVKFLGSKTHKEVYEWLETIDLYTQPSRQEGLPRALIEAMSRGLPAFGANTAGIPELLEAKYIFSNTKKNVDEICDILITYNQKSMLQQAKINYKESKKYDRYVIEQRRDKFLRELKLEIFKL